MSDNGNAKFYDNLREGLLTELNNDYSRDGQILSRAFQTGVVSKLGYWEYRNLDGDGGTTQIQSRLAAKEYIFNNNLNFHSHQYGDCQSTLDKDGHLAPADWYIGCKGILDKGTREWEELLCKGSWKTVEETMAGNIKYLGWRIPLVPIKDRGAKYRPLKPRSTIAVESDPVSTTAGPSLAEDNHNTQLQGHLSASMTENAALKKRIAELELVSENAKKQK